jgi:hypothetical protein
MKILKYETEDTLLYNPGKNVWVEHANEVMNNVAFLM